jgi:anti-sigma regulatory factor (Ser/Thr protein kinase)
VLQHAMLGEPRLPVGFAARYQAAVIPLEVGGDWYDVTELDGDRIGVVVGDCVGRGVAAAAVMGRLRSACQALMLTAGGPAAVLTALDRLVSHVPGAFAATAFCAVIDAPRGEIVYSCAGHLPAMLAAPDGATEALDGARWVPLGVSASRPRPEGTATLAPGSTLVFYTDGLVERRGESLDVGLGRLAASLAARAADGPNAIADQLMRSQQPPSGYEDDIAVVLYRQPPDDLRLALAADASVLASLRRELRRWLTRAGIVGDPADEIVLAIGEAAANAAEHAGGTASLDVTVSLSRRVVSVEVRDDGIWKPAVDEPLRGHGIPIMRAMMDTLTVEHGEAGTRVRMAKEIGR